MARRPAAVSKQAPPESWEPAPFTLAEVHAIKAVEAGTATPDQQIRAFVWICSELARVNRPTFHPDSERASVFAEGKRFVGLQLMRLAKTPVDVLRAEIVTERKSDG